MEPERQGRRRQTRPTDERSAARIAIGYVRVSTDMQAQEGISLEAQHAAISNYCLLQGLRLLQVHQDVMSGGSDRRPGLDAALAQLQDAADVLIVVKVDRLSRSLRHFCELYEDHFKGGEKELVAIREAIRLDSALGRGVLAMLLVFAQMEREATGERTREAIRHIRRSGYHFGKVPYGKKAIAAPDNPRMRVLVEDAAAQAVIAQIRAWGKEGIGITEMSKRLNAAEVPPPQGPTWRKGQIYNLRVRLGLKEPTHWKLRAHTDQELKECLADLRLRGHSQKEIAEALNRIGFRPLKGSCFTARSVQKLLARMETSKILTPRGFLIALLDGMKRKRGTSAKAARPSYPKLAEILTLAGYPTPRGHRRWWPAQVQLLLEGRFDRYYAARRRAGVQAQARGPRHRSTQTSGQLF